MIIHNKLNKKYKLIFVSLFLSIFFVISSGCSSSDNSESVNNNSSNSSINEQSQDNSNKEYRLSWLDKSQNIDTMNDKDLLNNYINLKLFEQEYRIFVYDKISNSERFQFPTNKIYKDKSYNDPNGTIEVFIQDCFDEEHLRKYFDSKIKNSYIIESIKKQNFSKYSDYLNSIVSSTKLDDKDKKIVKAYLKNFSIENGKPKFKDESMIYKYSFLNDKIFLNTEISSFKFKFNANNEDFRGHQN